MVKRREFIGSALSFGALGCVSGIGAKNGRAGEFGKDCIMRFGVASDVHVLSDWRDANCRDLDHQPEYLEKALRWFDAEKADAVVFPGDFAHTGRVSEAERFAAVWEKVFPSCVAADGRRVERMIVTGNHEVGQWPSLWAGMDDETLKRVRLDYDREHLAATWKRLFHEDYELMWKRQVKGITFIGCQWPRKGFQDPDIEKGIAALAADVPADRPFFYIQHAHPRNTCYGDPGGAESKETATRALSLFPNAVALSGHSHNSLCDERSVWQGAFTSIGCGSVAEGTPAYNKVRCDNGAPPYAGDYPRKRMKCIPQIGNDGRCCLLVEVYSDHLVVKRRSLAFDEPLGQDWIVPVPARVDGEFSFSRRLSEWKPPQFPADARLRVETCSESPALAGPGLVGKPCVRIVFPHALPAGPSRVLDYAVMVADGDGEILRTHVLDPGYYLPEARATADAESIIGLHELPSGRRLTFTVVPRNCYGAAGAPLRVTARLDPKSLEI